MDRQDHTTTLAWTPNARGQAQFAFEDANRFVALAGGWGSGKTWVGARKLVRLHALNAVDDAGAPTGGPTGLQVRPS